MIENLVLKRIYEPASEEDGKRILVDRIWPRGISKDKAQLDLWMKEIAPSTELRKEFNHKPERFEEFKEQYIKELQEDDEKRLAIVELLRMIEKEKVTLLFGAKDEVHNQAVVLKEVLERKLEQ
ncbi:DUF488 domain-containing protein [Fredinandcohnia sp. QZ13]|uniref:DUF488 domain-containing protein n=1 Tax=Fredinandcohnia sp. QZ13 TaxID=3073144 RepID=UPI0028530504|nr:DUF488 domain-containing protein [Fredinandcohnia sp. QZ13]MDR4887930.1 DUF488 domain-containing protein [Fredinandcohnia sp. QZ13]